MEHPATKSVRLADPLKRSSLRLLERGFGRADIRCMDSVISTGLRGMLRGLEDAVKSADAVSRAFLPESTVDPIDALIDLKQAGRQVEASAAVIKSGDELNRSILDILA